MCECQMTTPSFQAEESKLHLERGYAELAQAQIETENAVQSYTTHWL